MSIRPFVFAKDFTMKKLAVLATIFAMAFPIVSCKEKTVTEPIGNFEYFLKGCVKVRNQARLVDNYSLVMVDNQTQQQEKDYTVAGFTKEWRWNSEPKTLWISGSLAFGTGYSPTDSKNVIPTCVQHPESSKEGVFLCRFTIEVDPI